MHARRRAIQAAMICLTLLPAAAHAQQQNPNQVPERLVGPGNGHNQPTRQRTNTLLRQDNLAPSQQQERQQLKTLNQLNQQLLPGAKPPAPDIKPSR